MAQNMAQDPYKYFRPEARNLLDQFAQGILELEKDGKGAATVQRLLRLAHTLKGAARVVKQVYIADRAHAIEDALAPFRDKSDGVAREQIDTVLAHLDEIGSQLVTLVPADSGQTPSSTKRTIEEAPRSIRADIAEMDAVLDGVAETHARLNGIRRAAEGIEQAGHLADLLHAQLASHGAMDRSRQGGNSGHLIAIAEELRRKLGSHARDIGASIEQVDREMRQLRDAAEGLRLVPADTLFTALERTARDSARALSKQVAFEGTGGDIRLDADVLGLVQGALIQLVRNAVAHGIEPEGERLAAGKPAAGRITVDVSRRGRKIAFACSDDGCGVDLEAVRKIAVQRGLASTSTKDFSAEDAVRILLHGGISTAATVTNTSGRGVGLDVVREAAERLGGEITAHIEPGRGTRFEIVIPRSLTAMEALMVEADCVGSAIAIPLDGVRRTLRLSAGDISSAASGASILYEDKAIAFLPLATALDAKQASVRRNWTVIIVAGTDGIAAIGVKRLLGTGRIVVRPLPDRLGASPLVVGASLDADNNPQLILDPDGLVAAARGVHGGAAIAAAPKCPVLVVDDSLTTRMLEQSILESAGYDVDVASSGEEALDQVRRKPYALVLSDVEMPGIDGFTLVERLRSDPALRGIPAILVTSRNAPEDRQRGRDVGAQGYIVKSEFDQAELLSMIGPMVA
jgi:two-component system chemotaxis sensor kinase CheA